MRRRLYGQTWQAVFILLTAVLEDILRDITQVKHQFSCCWRIKFTWGIRIQYPELYIFYIVFFKVGSRDTTHDTSPLISSREARHRLWVVVIGTFHIRIISQIQGVLYQQISLSQFSFWENLFYIDTASTILGDLRSTHITWLVITIEDRVNAIPSQLSTSIAVLKIVRIFRGISIEGLVGVASLTEP